MLCEIITHLEKHPGDPVNPAFKGLSPVEIVDGLKNQLGAFWHNKWPFDQQVSGGNPLAWWEDL